MKLEGVIYCGDNLYWMSRLPDEVVDLCYIDPPFFSNRNHKVIFGDGEEIRSFEDRWSGGIENYIDWMRDRVQEIHRMLKPTGSFYLHCDWHASHYLKVMCDEVFGYSNFINEVVWYYTSGGGRGRRWFNRKHDTILVYGKTRDYFYDGLALKDTRTKDEGSFGGYFKTDKDGRRYQEVRTEGKTYKYYIDQPKNPDDVWMVPNIPQRDLTERMGYPTQKPEALLERIIEVSSNPQDLVFDCFCGCGTTLVAAQKLARRWLGIDVSPTGCKLVQQRLSKLGVKAEIVGLPRTIQAPENT